MTGSTLARPLSRCTSPSPPKTKNSPTKPLVVTLASNWLPKMLCKNYRPEYTHILKKEEKVRKEKNILLDSLQEITRATG
ncbi:hypothetical protein QFC19_000107 [Naganishia cerealis]|uniref:Uncharacterized protein n=1 Tax=Naganishia cerealis TaxID=610337 RepID=A0ACC2WR59_9TREE|nr:hypothetical protein QFC19_000107 [Naganishia cerealis]